MRKHVTTILFALMLGSATMALAACDENGGGDGGGAPAVGQQGSQGGGQGGAMGQPGTAPSNP